MANARGTIVNIEAGRQPEPSQAFDPRLTVAESSSFVRCSDDTIRRGYTSGHLKIERMGARLQCVRIRQSALESWLADGARTR